MKKVKVWLLAAVMALAVVLSGCGVAGGGKKIVLNFFGWGGIEEQQIFKTMVGEFNKTYSQYKVNYRAVVSDNYISTLAGYKNNPRNMPDVFYMPDVNFVQWASETDIMEDLTPYIEASTVFTVDNVWQEGIDAYRYDKENNRFGTGAMYALPKDLGPNVLAYNKKIVSDKGVTVISDSAGTKGYDPATKTLNDKVSMTWAQYVAFCKDVKSGSLNETNSIVGVTHYPLETAYISMGGSFLDASKKTVQLDNAAYAEALQFVADLSNRFGVMTTAEGQSSQNGLQRFSSGLAATSWIGAWNTPELWACNFDWDILPTPLPNQSGDLEDVSDGIREGAVNATYLGSVGIAVSSKSANKDAAYKLAEFLTVSPEAQRLNYKLGMAVPNLKDMAEGEFLTTPLDDPMELNRPKNRSVYLDLVSGSPRRPQAYTYSDDWFDEMWSCADNSLNLMRVWSPNPAAQYGSHIDVFDWEANAKINNDFLSGLQAKVQAQLDKTKNKYNW